MSLDEIYLGDYAFGKGSHKILLKDEARREHCHIIGGTGTGKSKLMESMIRQDIENGKGLCLIDPHGNLFSSVLKWAVAYGFEHRLVVIDPSEKDYAVGLNFLEYNPEYFDAGQHVENVIYEIGRAREEDIFATSQVVNWLRYFLQLSALSGITMGEVYHLLNENNKRLRLALTERLSDDPAFMEELKDAWRLYDETPKAERAQIMKLPVWSRVQTFRATKTMRLITGQVESTVDFYEAMEKGRIVLVNLHGKLSDNERRLLGAMVIDKIYQASIRRNPERSKLFYVYIDEFGNFVSERIAQALEEFRKRQVSFILAHQELEQLKSEGTASGRRLLAAIMTNAKIKLAFRISRADAEAMALEMFAGFIHGNEVKHEQKVTFFWPHLTTARSHARGETESVGEASSFMEGLSQISSQAAGQVFIPGAGFLDSGLVTQSFSSGSTSGFTSANGRSEIHGYSTSNVEMEFPFYDLVPAEQVVSTTFFSIEEIKERYIQFLQNQADRFFHLKILGQTNQAPIALMTPTVEAIDILPSMLRQAKHKILERYSRPIAEVEKMIAVRRQELLQVQAGREEEDQDLEYNQDTYEPRQ